ncbi:hypothetical protein, partial [Nonomuraea sp. NPDC049695]|uniref:hypothetical protein n=1 Tax=Nonomuraea sp. NPDC049695 TaxID=3154734 RepID=UPI00343CC2D0
MVNDHDKKIVIDLYTHRLDEQSFTEIEGTTVAYAPIDDAEDAFAVRDLSNLDAGAYQHDDRGVDAREVLAGVLRADPDVASGL